MTQLCIKEQFIQDISNIKVITSEHFLLKKWEDLKVEDEAVWQQVVKSTLLKLFGNHLFTIDEEAFDQNEIESYYYIRHPNNYFRDESEPSVCVFNYFPVGVMVINKIYGLSLVPTTDILNAKYIPRRTRKQEQSSKYESRLYQLIFNKTGNEKAKTQEQIIAQEIQDRINAKYAGASKIYSRTSRNT